MSCSPAQLASAKKYRESHKEEAAAFRDSHKEDARAYMATYHQNHKDEVRAQSAAWYEANREVILARRADYRAAHRDVRRAKDADRYQRNRDAILEKSGREQAEFHEWLQILRTNCGCGDCETHEGGLLHHHVDPATKRYNVSHMYNHSHEALQAELEKCVVLCRSCHMNRHKELRAAT